MNDVACRRASELLPERARGALRGDAAEWLDAHLSSCSECRAELSLVRTLSRAGARPPAELAGRIRSALREEAPRREAPFRSRRWPRWAVAVAATVVLALGTARTLGRESRPSEAELWQSYLEEQVPAPWTADDGLVAGAPVLADLSVLSDEELAVVLEELGP